jgi:hypothetical protein
VLVDSNVLLDIATNDPKWSAWSGRALADCAEHATLVINPIIYAEVSIRYTSIEALDAVLSPALYDLSPGRPLSWPGSASCTTAAAGGPKFAFTGFLYWRPRSCWQSGSAHP